MNELDTLDKLREELRLARITILVERGESAEGMPPGWTWGYVDDLSGACWYNATRGRVYREPGDRDGIAQTKASIGPCLPDFWIWWTPGAPCGVRVDTAYAGMLALDAYDAAARDGTLPLTPAPFNADDCAPEPEGILVAFPALCTGTST